MSLEKNSEAPTNRNDNDNVDNAITSISTNLEHNVQSNGEIILTDQGIVWATGIIYIYIIILKYVVL